MTYRTYNIVAEGRTFHIVAIDIESAKADLFAAYGEMNILTWSMD